MKTARIAKSTMRIVGVVAGVVIVGIAALLLTNDSPACAEEVQAESDSPDGRWRATVRRVNCGATTGFGTVVNVNRAKHDRLSCI